MMPFEVLHEGLVNLAQSFEMRGTVSAYGQVVAAVTDEDSRFRRVESIAHELAHGIVLFGRPAASRRVATVIRKMRNDVADEHEAVTQRVELELLRRLDVTIDLRLVWKETSWRNVNNMRWSRMLEPLTEQELSWVRIAEQWVWSTVL